MANSFVKPCNEIVFQHIETILIASNQKTNKLNSGSSNTLQKDASEINPSRNLMHTHLQHSHTDTVGISEVM